MSEMFNRQLTFEEAELIREANTERLRLLKEAEKLSIKALMGKFDLSESSVRDIIMHRTYKEA